MAGRTCEIPSCSYRLLGVKMNFGKIVISVAALVIINFCHQGIGIRFA